MGNGGIISCNSCGYSEYAFEGIGFAYVLDYGDCKSAIAKGEHGKVAKEALNSVQKPFVAVENVLYQCDKCGKYEIQPKLDIYDTKGLGGDSLPLRAEKGFKLIYKHKHNCSECGGELKRRYITALKNKADRGELLCPCCGEKLSINTNFLWD